jgi:hypothetical protein
MIAATWHAPGPGENTKPNPYFERKTAHPGLGQHANASGNFLF